MVLELTGQGGVTEAVAAKSTTAELELLIQGGVVGMVENIIAVDHFSLEGVGLRGLEGMDQLGLEGMEGMDQLGLEGMGQQGLRGLRGTDPQGLEEVRWVDLRGP